MGRKEDAALVLLGAVPVIWAALVIAPSAGGGIAGIIPALDEGLRNPLDIKLCAASLKTALLFLCAYGLAAGGALASRGKYRRGEEHGSAGWGDTVSVNRRYEQKPAGANKILTQNVSMGLDCRKHGRNLNTIVCGGSGTGKTRHFAAVNLLQASDGQSFFVLDPKSELLSRTGNFLLQKGYTLKILDLLSMEKSHCYNPFVYLNTDNDVQRLVTNLFKSTTPHGSKSSDPFWDTAAEMLLLALVFYLHYEAPPEEQNFAMVMEMLRAGAIDQEESVTGTALDDLFAGLEAADPDHIAVKYYKAYHSGAARTIKSIQITLAARLEKFNLESLASLTSADELDLTSMGEKKTALFAVIPDSDSSFNFLISILYTQLFQQLFWCADNRHGGTLPVPVHFLMDEFANVPVPDSFDRILSVMRSRGVFVSIILQNMSQLRAMFEKQWESIVGNCDEFLYLGGNEQSTHKYVSEMLGKATIDTNTYGQTKGRNGSSTKNFQKAGRELMTPDEVRMLDNRYAILLVRGEPPVLDLKYDIMKHPNTKYTTDGGAEPYRHGEVTMDTADIAVTEKKVSNLHEVWVESEYELLSAEDLEENCADGNIRGGK